MNRERIRLRPTGLWILFGPILGCMWLAAINYSNNLVYAILYLIGSLTFVSIFHTWRNLAGLEVEYLRVHSAFAGGEVRVEIHFRNATRHAVYGLFFARLEEETNRRASIPLGLPGGGVLRVKSGDTCSVDLFFTTGGRGQYKLSSLLMGSSYPFGLVFASFRLPVSAEYFVYPEPRGSRLLPELHSGDQEGFAAHSSSGDDFAGVRAYAQGESLRHVDWKAYARGRPMSVKQFAGAGGRELWLDAETVPGANLEERLSQLTLWLVEAEKDDIPFGLRLGDAILPLGNGPDHVRRGLEILAVSGARWKG